MTSFGTRRMIRRPVRHLAACSAVAVIMLIACGSAHAEWPLATLNYVGAVRDPLAGFLSEAARRFDIPEQWIRNVMQAESAGDARALSPAGAMGLMQIMPDTWAHLRARYSLGSDPYDPHDNIIAGAGYLRELHDRYGEAGFLAAYNAGAARYEDHLATGRPLPVETQNYVAMLTPMVAGTQDDRAIVIASTTQSWTDAPLFMVQVSRIGKPTRSPVPMLTIDRSAAATPSDWTGLTPQSNGLFVATSARIPSP